MRVECRNFNDIQESCCARFVLCITELDVLENWLEFCFFVLYSFTFSSTGISHFFLILHLGYHLFFRFFFTWAMCITYIFLKHQFFSSLLDFPSLLCNDSRFLIHFTFIHLKVITKNCIVLFANSESQMNNIFQISNLKSFYFSDRFSSGKSCFTSRKLLASKNLLSTIL